MCVCVCVCVCMCMCVCMCVCVCACTNAYMCIMCTCLCVRASAYVCVLTIRVLISSDMPVRAHQPLETAGESLSNFFHPEFPESPPLPLLLHASGANRYAGSKKEAPAQMHPCRHTKLCPGCECSDRQKITRRKELASQRILKKWGEK